MRVNPGTGIELLVDARDLDELGEGMERAFVGVLLTGRFRRRETTAPWIAIGDECSDC